MVSGSIWLTLTRQVFMITVIMNWLKIIRMLTGTLINQSIKVIKKNTAIPKKTVLMFREIGTIKNQSFYITKVQSGINDHLLIKHIVRAKGCIYISALLITGQTFT